MSTVASTQLRPMTETGISADLRPNVSHVAGAVAWFVLHTRSRQEKAAAAAAEAAGATCFVPTVRQIKYYGHRRRVSELPLFPCYAFLRGTLEHAYGAISLKRVVQILPIRDQERFEREIAQIRLAIEGQGELSPYRFFVKGRRVRVTAGPFQGVEGLVEEGPRQNRIVLQVHTIGRALSMEIDASLLELID